MTFIDAAEAFSATAQAYTEVMVPALTPVAKEVVCRAALAPDDAVLDVGTGTGTAAALCTGAQRRVTGLDAAPGMLAVARRQHPGIDFVESDLRSMPFSDGSFDVVVSVHALLFVEDRIAGLREMRRVTSPRGRLSLSVPGPPEVTPSAVFADLYREFGLDGRRDYPTEARLAGWAQDAGWTDVATSADGTTAIRLNGEDGVRRWLAVGPSGIATAEWPLARLHAFAASSMEAAPRDPDGTIRLPFGALYLTARVEPGGDVHGGGSR